jgi:hypothetical protein
MQHGHEYAAWTWTCSMDMDMQHGHGWIYSMDMDINIDMDIDCINSFFDFSSQMPLSQNVKLIPTLLLQIYFSV